MKLREIIQEAIKEANVIDEQGWFISGWNGYEGHVGAEKDGVFQLYPSGDKDITWVIYPSREEALNDLEGLLNYDEFNGGGFSDESEPVEVMKYEGPYNNPPEKTKWLGLKGANVKTKIKEEVNQDNLKEEIELYKKNSAEVAEMQKSIEDVLKKVKEKTSQENSRLKAIINFMKNFDLKKVEADKWVAELEESPAFTSPAISYKDMYEKALTKVNAATLTVIKKLEAEHLLGKAAMKKTDLKITDKPINEGVGGFVNWLKGLIPAVKNYNKVVDELPEIKNEEQIRHGAAIMGHSLPKDIRYKDAKNVVNK